jgi:hypothetical protein
MPGCRSARHLRLRYCQTSELSTVPHCATLQPHPSTQQPTVPPAATPTTPSHTSPRKFKHCCVCPAMHDAPPDSQLYCPSHPHLPSFNSNTKSLIAANPPAATTPLQLPPHKSSTLPPDSTHRHTFCYIHQSLLHNHRLCMTVHGQPSNNNNSINPPDSPLYCPVSRPAPQPRAQQC